jgi:nicotinamidase/pyrazinamidase
MGNQTSSKIVPIRSYSVLSNSQTPKKFVLGIIDVQNDFCKGGALAVTDADLTIGPINKLRYLFDDHIKTFISQDWHNADHISFAASHEGAKPRDDLKLHLQMDDGTYVDTVQKVWPVHCVKNTRGSDLHSDLIVRQQDSIIRKGTKTNVESYSAFGDENKNKYEKTNLNNWLTENGISDIILTGIATDYCVLNTALDAIRLGYRVHLILSCTKGVAEDTTIAALKTMKEKGVIIYNDVDSFVFKQQDKIVSNWVHNNVSL